MSIFYTEDATKPFLEPESVDLFITNPPFFGFNVESYGEASKQIHNAADISEFIDNLVLITLEMQRSLSKIGNILLILPNKPFVFEYLARVRASTELNIGQLLSWDLMRTSSEINNYSALVINLYKDAMIDPGNKIIQVSLQEKPDLSEFEHIAFPWDSLPKEIYSVLIEKFSSPGDVVCDIMGGTGSICLAAVDTNRKFIYNDVSSEQTELAIKRYEAYTKDK